MRSEEEEEGGREEVRSEEEEETYSTYNNMHSHVLRGIVSSHTCMSARKGRCVLPHLLLSATHSTVADSPSCLLSHA